MSLSVTMWIIWLIIAIVLVIIEIFTTTAVALCLAIGAIGAFVVALVGLSLEVQLIVCAVTMVASLLFVPRFIRRHSRMFQPAANGASNMDALIGREGIVIVDGGDCARIKIDGDRWAVRSDDGSALSAGQKVEVLAYDSIVLIVRPVLN